ncbi:MAG: VanZ family protein, partial [Aeromicrobium sp.]|nr:VanZ family protein [Aeromicrobium sp.]
MITGLYAIGLALIGTWPTHVDKHLAVVNFPPVQWMTRQLNLTTLQGYTVVEFSANVLLFLPLGALLAVFRPGWTWIQVVLTGAILSTLIELF